MKRGKRQNTGLKIFGSKVKKRTGRLVFAALFTLAIAGISLASFMLIRVQVEYRAAQNEYKQLRDYSPIGDKKATPAPEPPPSLPGDEAIEDLPDEPEPEVDLLQINPDYIGWIKIDGTPIDYPVVQGRDNEKYVRHTFTGEYNRAGTIFMDWKSKGAFEAPLPLLYGHNLRDGGMFAHLHNYRYKSFLDEHPVIYIVTKDDQALTYRIFAVVLTSVFDDVFTLFDKSQDKIERYFAGHGAPKAAERFLVLSTCVGSGDDDERLLVLAALEE